MNFTAFKEIANSLINADWPSILIILIIFLATPLCAYLKARIIKSAEIVSMNQNFEAQLTQHNELLRSTNKINNENFEVLKQQQIELSEKTALISESFKRESTSHEIFLRNYHGKSVESIDVVYKGLLELQKATKELALFETQEHKNNVYKATLEFIDILDRARIWLPPSLVMKFDSHYKRMQTLTNKFINATEKYQALRNVKLSDDHIDKIIDDQENFYDFIGDELHTNTNELIDEIINFLSKPQTTR